MKKAVFHIGYPKTGTTTLQHFLADNDAQLRQCGFYYADRTYIAHVGNASDIYIAGLPGFDPDKLKRIFDEDVKNSDGLTILYSHEILFNLGHDFFAFLADYFDEIKVIVYLRRQDKWLESYKRWQIAAGAPMKDSKREVPYCMTDYHKEIKKIAKHLGESSILIRPFERKQFYKQNINYDFLVALGIEPEKFENFVDSRPALNISLNGQALVFKKLLNRYLPLRPYQLKNSKDIFGTWRATHINKALGDYPLDPKDAAYQVMSYNEKTEVLKRASAGNSALEKQYFDGKSMFNEPLPEADIISYDDLDTEEIKDVASFAFKSLMDRMGDISKDYLLASIAASLDAFDEYDRYSKLFMDDAKMIEKSKWFDAAFYFANNPGLPEGTNPILHYLVIGYKENADPCTAFSTEQYRLDYPEVSAYDMCPLVHYLRIGKDEGKKPKPSLKPKEKTQVEKLAEKIWNKIF